MSNEEKMRAEFDRKHDSFIHEDKGWIMYGFDAGVKACAAIKDAEIAEYKKGSTFWKTAYHELQEVKDAEIAARDLMIKELREALKPFAENIHEDFNAPCHNGITTSRKCGRCGKAHRAYEALAKSENHNSRALEKMLVESRIDVLEDVRLDFDVQEKLTTYKAKLAELNKE